jgi:hypothetical protein
MADRRAAPRYPLILIAEVTDSASGARLISRTSDVSRTGCYVDTLNPLPRGSLIRLRLQHEQENFETDARVVYVSPGLGMGLMFPPEVQPDQLAVLDRWLAEAGKSAR